MLPKLLGWNDKSVPISALFGFQTDHATLTSEIRMLSVPFSALFGFRMLGLQTDHATSTSEIQMLSVPFSALFGFRTFGFQILTVFYTKR